MFDRTNGQPVWPINERPVPKGDVPGEWYAPTQPFPTKPPAFDRQGVSIDDLIDFTPELRAEAVKLVSRYKLGPIFTPPVVSKVEGPLGDVDAAARRRRRQLGRRLLRSRNPASSTCSRRAHADVARSGAGAAKATTSAGSRATRRATAAPAARGAAGRGAAARAAAERAGGTAAAAAAGPRPQRRRRPARAAAAALTVQGLPFIKPPYGRITAIDLNKGDIVWQVAHGETPDNIRNHPALKGLTIPRTGQTGVIGTLVTKTLVDRRRAGRSRPPPQGRGRDAPRLRQGDRQGSRRRCSCRRRRPARR